MSNAVQEASDAIRYAELGLMLPYIEQFVPSRDLRILEIGAGTARCSDWFTRLGAVTATDPFASATAPEGVRFVAAPAEKLPFADGSFDLVFSTSVLEHLEHFEEAMRESCRVATPDALHLHVVPNATWKGLALVAHFDRMGRRLLSRVTGRRAGPSSTGGADAGGWRSRGTETSSVRSRLLRAMPAVHGTSKTHLAELLSFRVEAWRKRLTETGFSILREEPLILYSPPELPLLPPTERFRDLGVASCTAFFLRAR